MTREPDSGSARSGGVDTATRVLSVRDVRTTAPEPEGASGSDVPEAVAAAWVRRGGEESPEGTQEGDGGPEAAGSDESDGNEPQGADEPAGAAGKAPEEAPEPSGPSGGGDDAPKAPETAAEARTATAEDAEPVAPAEPAEAPAKGDAKSDTGSGPGNDTDGDDGDRGDQDAADPKPEADAEPDADPAPEPLDHPTTVFKAVRPPKPRSEAKPEPKAGSEPEPEPETDAKPEAEAKSPAEAKPEAKSDPKPAPVPEPKSEDRPGWRPDAKPEPRPGTKAAPEPKATPQPKGDAKPEPGSKPEPEPSSKPKPEVDQPTTMLKLGTPPERDSKFVALKPLDDPATRRPPAAAPGPGPGPGIAPTTSVPQVGPEMTTQQPLPPKPPLDLLAELTNTPPPPQTPVRALVRRVKIWTPLVLLLILVFAIAQAFRPLPTPTLALTADESYTFDGGKVSLPWPSEGQGSMDVNGIGAMDGFGDQKPVAIGSVAKAMTAYIVLKDHPMKSGSDGEKIKVDALAEKEGGYDKDGESTLNTVKEGDVLTERDALSAIMIPSANNIARLLARWDAGSEAAFIKKMNATAKELGMKNTTYTDASGLKETTVSSAEDQVKLGNELVRIPALMEITKLPSWKDPSGQVWQNYNRLVPYNGALGIKTGTTTKAGGNLLFAATKEVDGETVTVVGAILGQHTAPIIDTVNAVSKTAMIAAQDALKSAKILKKGDVVGYVDDGLGGHTPVVVTKDVSAVGWTGLKVRLSFDADDVPHTAKAGTKVGTLTVGDGDSGAVKVPVQLQRELTEPGLGAKLTRIT